MIILAQKVQKTFRGLLFFQPSSPRPLALTVTTVTLTTSFREELFTLEVMTDRHVVQWLRIATDYCCVGLYTWRRPSPDDPSSKFSAPSTLATLPSHGCSLCNWRAEVLLHLPAYTCNSWELTFRYPSPGNAYGGDLPHHKQREKVVYSWPIHGRTVDIQSTV